MWLLVVPLTLPTTCICWSFGRCFSLSTYRGVIQNLCTDYHTVEKIIYTFCETKLSKVSSPRCNDDQELLNNFVWQTTFRTFIYCLQDRFNGLTLLNIHNYMKIDREEIINRLAVKYPKRLRMLNMFEED